MRRLIIHIALAIIGITGGTAQIQSVELYGSGALSVGKRFQVTDATAIGGGMKIHYDIGSDLMITIDGGYAKYAIEQTNEVQQWGWTIWERRYRNWVSIYTSDTANFSSRIQSVQSMEVLPVSVNLAYRIEIASDLVVRPSAGVGIEFYTRKLYHEETWTRKYRADEHEFTYTYHNFAPYKYGNPVFINAGLATRYRFSDLMMFNADVAYKSILETKGEFGYDQYPMIGAVSFSLGISFHY
jgi:hypothetical protein